MNTAPPNTTLLLDKLTQIERAVGVETNITVRLMILEAQDCLLEMQKAKAERLHRESRRSALEPLSLSRSVA
jgi:hypothetical protein